MVRSTFLSVSSKAYQAFGERAVCLVVPYWTFCVKIKAINDQRCVTCVEAHLRSTSTWPNLEFRSDAHQIGSIQQDTLQNDEMIHSMFKSSSGVS